MVGCGWCMLTGYWVWQGGGGCVRARVCTMSVVETRGSRLPSLEQEHCCDCDLGTRTSGRRPQRACGVRQPRFMCHVMHARQDYFTAVIL